VGAVSGLFVVFEGIDGSGKSTLMRLVAERLAEQNIAVVETFEPGATALGQMLRTEALSGTYDPVCETLLFAADRADHVRRILRPALADGAVVLCDRYEASNIAYQGRWRGVGEDAVRQVSRFASGELTADLTVWCDLPADVAAARRGGEHPDELDRAATSASDVLASSFAQQCGADGGWLRLDATRPPDVSAGEVVDRIVRLRRRGRLLLVCGPSGSGKNTLVDRLTAERDDTWYSVSATTRPARTDETDGAAYTFVTDAEFDAMVADGQLLEWATYAGHRYGTPAAAVDERIAAGVNVVCIVELEGAGAIRQRRNAAKVVFVSTPEEELARRLAVRGSEDAAMMERRLQAARHELATGPAVADVVVDGTDIDAAVAAVHQLLN
jgi:guanylate kinase